MVSKITILEPHFEGAQFGPASIEDFMGDEEAEQAERESEETDESKSRLVMFLQGATVFVIMFVVLRLALSRLQSEEEEEEETEQASKRRIPVL